MPFSVTNGLHGLGSVDLLDSSLMEVMRVYPAGELIPIEGGKDSSVNGALLKGVMKATCGFR